MATNPPVSPTDYAITIGDLTSGSVVGDGVFDKLMASMKAHLQQEFSLNRIKGPEYAEVYLGGMNNVMNTAMQFLLQKTRIGLEAQLLEQQIILAELEVQKANIALEILEQERQKTEAEVDLVIQQVQQVMAQTANLKLEALNIPLQGEMIQAQTENQKQQKLNLIAEAANLPKQGLLVDAQVAMSAQQKVNLAAEALNIPKQGLMIDAQAAVQGQQKLNLQAEALNLPKQGIILDAQGDLNKQQALNAVTEGEVLEAQVCKLKAEYDLTMNKNTQTTAETLLIGQKTATEKAQVQAIGVDPDSVVGRQKALYKAQTDGFQRDAELKAAKLLVDTWSARRMSDEGTVADDVNKLSDANIGRAVTVVLNGVNA